MNQVNKYSLTLVMLFLSCNKQDCPEKINLKPMYGEVKKCKEQIESDSIFLHENDKIYKDRKVACIHQLELAWHYFFTNILDTSMMRFNQSWLLDSTNADIYWGFGVLLGKQHKYKESLIFFDKSLQLNPNNAKVWQNAATSLGNLFSQTNDVKHLNIAIDYLKKSISLDSTNLNAVAFGLLTKSYSYFSKKDSARKYMELADKLDPNAVNPDVRKSLNE